MNAIAELDQVAKQTFKYFAGAGKKNKAKVDRWHARDVLQHFLYFHDATAWGIQSAALGGPAWQLPADADTINEVCRRLHEHESVDELLTQLKQSHARLIRAAKKSPDLERPCFKRPNGEPLSGRQRLEILAKHWTEHVEELKTAAAAKKPSGRR